MKSRSHRIPNVPGSQEKPVQLKFLFFSRTADGDNSKRTDGAAAAAAAASINLINQSSSRAGPRA